MRILLTMNLPCTRSHGGTNRSNRTLAEELARRGHQLRVVGPALASPSPITHGQLLEELAAEGIAVETSGGIDRFLLNGVEVRAVAEASQLRAHLADEIRQFDTDWVLVSSEDPTQNLLDAALKVCPSKVVYLAHTPQMLPFGPASLYPGKVRTEMVGRAAAIVAISRFVADYIKRWAGFETFVNHPPHYGKGPFPRLARFDNPYVLLMNACEVKGLSIFMALAEALPEVRFAALPGYGTTEADRAALGRLPNVTMLRNCKDLDDIFKQTRVLLMPSLWVEGFGMAVVDAMLRGIPVLASDFGGLVEAKLGTDFLLPARPVTQFEDRLDQNLLPVPVVPEQDVGPWLQALRGLLAERGEYERQSQAAYDAARNFVSGLSVAPFEKMLLELGTKDRNRPPAAAAPETHSNGQKPDKLKGLTNLSPEQKALLMMRMRKKAAEQKTLEANIPPIRRVPRGSPLPLSFAQQRLWFIHQLDPQGVAYNVPTALRLSGQLDLVALQRTLTEVVRRHESLRTRFIERGGEPYQVIEPARSVPLPVVDLSGLDEARSKDEATRLAGEEAREPFNLGRGPLVRARLLRVADEEHVALWTTHHVVSDGWSTGVLVREVAALYAAYVRGEGSPLAELPVQYADYAAWQRGWLKGEVLEQQLSYWREQLADVPAELALPRDRVRGAGSGGRGAAEQVELNEEVSERLRAVARREGATLFMVLLAAFQTLLYRYTGQSDICVGTPVAGRRATEAEGLIGFFVNILPVRARVRGGMSFVELVREARERALGAYAHQDVPFEKLVEELLPGRALTQSPLVQAVLVVQNGPVEPLSLPGLGVGLLSVENPSRTFELMLSVTDNGRTMGCSMRYALDLYDARTVRAMLEHFRALLECVASDPSIRILDIPLTLDLQGPEQEHAAAGRVAYEGDQFSF